jgi:uncharacterized protein (DUF305 family)
MFKKHFEGRDKKPVPQQPVPQQQTKPIVPNSEEQDIAFLDSRMAHFDNEIETYQMKLENLKKEIRQLVSEKKKQQADKKIAEKKLLREWIEVLEENRLKIINKKLNLEVARSNVSHSNVIKPKTNQDDTIYEEIIDLSRETPLAQEESKVLDDFDKSFKSLTKKSVGDIKTSPLTKFHVLYFMLIMIFISFMLYLFRFFEISESMKDL